MNILVFFKPPPSNYMTMEKNDSKRRFSSEKVAMFQEKVPPSTDSAISDHETLFLPTGTNYVISQKSS